MLYIDVRVPRSAGGAISAWYMGTTLLKRPIEVPVTNRPKRKVPIDPLEDCSRQPSKKMIPPSMMELLRPNWSRKKLLIGGKEVVKHPTEKIATMKPASTEVIFELESDQSDKCPTSRLKLGHSRMGAM